MTNPIGDLHSITTADGKKLYAPDAALQFLVYGGYGAPPTNYQTRHGYHQDGETEVDYVLGPRMITVDLHYTQACDRNTFWNNRAALHEFLRPNRNGPLTFTVRLPDGRKRSLICRADPGLVLPPPSPDEFDWSVSEALNFVAFDPVWFDPTIVTAAQAGGASSDLVFPITFLAGVSIVFGTAGVQFNNAITYPGTWKSYPTITLTGPYTAAIIQNLSTGIVIYMVVPIVAGDQRIITLTPGGLSITNAVGVDKFGDLGADSNLVDFNIRPDPEVAGGVQTIQAILNGGTIGVSAVSIAYKVRYFAL